MKVTWYGYHTRDLPNFSVQEQVFFAQGLLYNPVLGLVKWSIILFLKRLGDRRKSIQRTLLGLLIFNLAHRISVFLVVVFQCSPVHMYWDHHRTDKILHGQTINPNYSCIDQATFSLSTAAIAILTDIAILLVPVAIMWNLQMPIRRKLAVILVLSIGWVVPVVGIIRIKFFVDFWYGRFPDPNWSLWNTLPSVENNVAIMASCGPAVKSFVNRYFPRVFGTSIPSRPSGNLYYATVNHELGSRSRADNSVVNPTVGLRGNSDSTEAIVKSEDFGESGGFPSGSEQERSLHAGRLDASSR